MNVRVGVGRAVVEDELLAPGARALDHFIETHLRPVLQACGFRLREVGLLTKTCLRQVDRLLQIERRFG